jgi:phosphotransferase system, enzyme I, PtsP
MDHTGLLLNISELNHILHKTTSLKTFLERCVDIVAQHFCSKVCSIYLYDREQKRIKLSSTIGLNQEKAATVSLKLGEGLTGLALEELRTIMVTESSKHPNYRYFPDLDEDKYDAYLGVPILRGIERIGVIVVQRHSSNPFHDEDAISLRGVANQLAAMIDYSRLLIASVTTTVPQIKMVPDIPKFIKGRSSSGGWAYGHVIVDSAPKQFDSIIEHLPTGNRTITDFNEAIAKTIDQLMDFQKQIEERLSDVASLIFSSHILLLQDEQFSGKMRVHINGGTEPAKAIVAVAEQVITAFSKQSNPYFQQKADDVRDVALRILENLAPGLDTFHNYKNAIVVASDLVPSDILLFSVENIAGIILIGGGVTSHVAILARSLKLPMIIADIPALLELPLNSTALIDGETGAIFINPDSLIRAPYEQRSKRRQMYVIAPEIPAHPVTIDGVAITMLANVNLLSDIGDARSMHAKGIGLYRTEFPFMIRSTFPTEEEQIEVYRRLIKGMEGLPVTFRTLDIGGDKALSYYSNSKENNPFLGMRSIRFCLENREVFKAQIRAILRAGVGADFNLMFPMIASVDELEKSKEIVEECKRELTVEGKPFYSNPRIGIMIELPAVLSIIDELAKRCEFFSIGTNDLVQYMLAVDRTNEKVSKFYCPHHPSVLHAIKNVADAAARAGIGISICGDMAHEGRYLEFLIGVGIRTISIDPLYFPMVSAAIQNIHSGTAVEKARKLLACCTINGVEEILFSSVENG